MEARALLEAERRLWGLEDEVKPEPKPRNLEGDREALRALLGTLTRRTVADLEATGLAYRPEEPMGQLPPAPDAHH